MIVDFSMRIFSLMNNVISKAYKVFRVIGYISSTIIFSVAASYMYDKAKNWYLESNKYDVSVKFEVQESYFKHLIDHERLSGNLRKLLENNQLSRSQLQTKIDSAALLKLDKNQYANSEERYNWSTVTIIRQSFLDFSKSLIDLNHQLSKSIYDSIPPVMSSFLILFEVENHGEATTMIKANIPIPENNSSMYFLGKESAENHFKCWSNDNFDDLDEINNFIVTIKNNELNGEFVGCSIKWEKPVALRENHKLTCVFSPNIDSSLNEMQTHLLRRRIEKLISKNGSLIVKSVDSEEKRIKMTNSSDEQVNANRKDTIINSLIVFALINMLITVWFIYRRPVSSSS